MIWNIGRMCRIFRSTRLNGDIGLHTDFTKSLFAEFKIEWKYDSEPAPDRQKNDFRYILSAGYQFLSRRSAQGCF